MCDCYHHACKVCGEPLPVHLNDYDTNREEVEVFCEKHLPDNDVVVFTLTEATKDRVPKKLSKKEIKQIRKSQDIVYIISEMCENREYPVGWKMGIRALTDNARNNARGNNPNLGVDWIEEKR